MYIDFYANRNGASRVVSQAIFRQILNKFRKSLYLTSKCLAIRVCYYLQIRVLLIPREYLRHDEMAVREGGDGRSAAGCIRNQHSVSPIAAVLLFPRQYQNKRRAVRAELRRFELLNPAIFLAIWERLREQSGVPSSANCVSVNSISRTFLHKRCATETFTTERVSAWYYIRVYISEKIKSASNMNSMKRDTQRERFLLFSLGSPFFYMTPCERQ